MAGPNRLLTWREFMLLFFVGSSVCIGATVLYAYRSAESDAAELEATEASIAAPARPPRDMPDTAAPLEIAPAPPPVEPQPVVVSVRGAVNDPGVYTLDGGARLHEVLEDAGGPAANADLSDINLAAKLIDGTTLTVPAKPEEQADSGRIVLRRGAPAQPLNPPQYTLSGWRPPAVQASAATPGASTASATTRINLNTATQEELETLPGIGPKLAERIMEFRKHTPFRSVNDLDFVSGIGPKRLEALRPEVTVE